MRRAVDRGARGAGLIAAGQAVKVVVQFVGTVILARLLTPEDFGIVAMVAIFIALGDTLRDLGMTTIGLQRRELSHQEASNLFWVNTLLGLLMFVALVSCTDVLVHFYNEPRLSYVVPALAPVLVINGLAAQLRVQLARQMRFGRLTLVDLMPQVVSLLVASVLATMGLEYWAVVLGTVSSALMGLAASWAFVRFLPLRPRIDSTALGMIQDGGAFGAAGFLTFLSQNVDTAVVGASYSATSLGVYNRAYQLVSLPMTRLVGPLTQVVVPMVNAAIKEGRDGNDVLKRVQSGLGIIVCWGFAWSGAVAPWLVPTLLGPGWEEAAALFQIFAVGGLVWTFSNVNYWRVIVANQGLQLAYFNLVSKSFAVVCIIAASSISLQAVAWAMVVGLFINWLGGLLWFSRVSNWPWLTYLGETSHIAAPGAAALATGVILMSLPTSPGTTYALTVAATTSLIFWIMLGAFQAGRSDILMLVRLIRRQLKTTRV